MANISVFGEPLLEIASTASGAALGPAVLGVAGDTLNTSVYLARLGHQVSFVTALGTDPYSDAILERLREEGVSTRCVARHPTRIPGLYAIRTDEHGERSFTYWRDNSAARDFFSLDEASELIGAAMDADLFYFSGISMAILSDEHREALLGQARACAAKGVRVAFDGNYRPYGWRTTADARARLEAIGAVASMVLPTAEDDDALFGAATPLEHGARWRALGSRCAVVKNGPDGAWVLDGDREPAHVHVAEQISPVDTTGAGDSFNAGFLAAWLDGASPAEAATTGNRLAGEVIRHRGAIIPPSHMPDLTR